MYKNSVDNILLFDIIENIQNNHIHYIYINIYKGHGRRGDFIG